MCYIHILFISGILVVFSESNYDNGFINISEERDQNTNLKFRKVGNDQPMVVPLESVLDKWKTLIVANIKSKNQIPAQKAKELSLESQLINYRDNNDESSITQEENQLLAPQYNIARQWWIKSKIEISSTERVNVQFTRIPHESKWLNIGKEKQTTSLNEFALNVEYNKLKTVPEEKKQLKPMEPIPWVEQYMVRNSNISNTEENTHQSTTENKLLKERDFISQSTQRTIHANKAVRSGLMVTNPSKNRLDTRKTKKLRNQSTTANHESNFLNWGLLLIEPSTKNKLNNTEEEHDQLEHNIQISKKKLEAKTQTLLESTEVDDDRNKALRKKVDTWYGNLQSRRELARWGAASQAANIALLKTNVQSELTALSKVRPVPKWEKLLYNYFPKYVDSRRLGRLRRQLLSRYNEPQAINYRRLLSLWQKELRRQLQIKWNRRPLVEISPGAFKSDIYKNPPDELAKHMQKLLALKKIQEEKKIDLNAGNEYAK